MSASQTAGELQRLRAAWSELKAENARLAGQLNKALAAARHYSETARSCNATVLQRNQEILRLQEQLRAASALPAICEEQEMLEDTPPAYNPDSSITDNQAGIEKIVIEAPGTSQAVLATSDSNQKYNGSSFDKENDPVPQALKLNSVCEGMATCNDMETCSPLTSPRKARSSPAQSLPTAAELAHTPKRLSGHERTPDRSCATTPDRPSTPISKAATAGDRRNNKRPLAVSSTVPRQQHQSQEQDQEQEQQQQRSRPSRAAAGAVASYKEPKLNSKMRRPRSVHL